MKLKKGVSFTIGGRTFRKEITPADAEIIRAQFGQDKLDKALVSKPKPEPVKEEKPPKSK